MNAYDIWRISTAIKLHFTTGYDAFKYNFKSRQLTPKAFEARKDMHYFVRAEKKFQRASELKLRTYIFANYIELDTLWFGDMHDKPFNKFKYRMQNFMYKFSKDLKQHDCTFDELLIPKPGELPLIVTSSIQNTCMLETPIALDIVTNFSRRIKCDNIIWESEKERIAKLTPFVSPWLDEKKIKEVILDAYSNV